MYIKLYKRFHEGGRKMKETYSSVAIKEALRALAVDPRYSDEQIDAMYDLVSAITGLSVDSVIDALEFLDRLIVVFSVKDIRFGDAFLNPGKDIQRRDDD